MRKVIVLAMIVGGFAGLLRPQVAWAQTTVPIYAVKFLCGTETFTGTPPDEPPVKPGNYATKIETETLTPGTGGNAYSWNVSVAGKSGVSSSGFVGRAQFFTVDIFCSSIAAKAKTFFPNGLPEFINGYVNIFPNTGVTLAVTGVYTSQGCVFREGQPPICRGPVSIEVVPETLLSFTVPPT